MKHVFALIALLLPLSAAAQEQLTRAQTLERLSHDLAEMQSVVESSRGKDFASYGSAKATVTDANASIHADASASSPVVAKPDVGDQVKLVGREGDWYRIEAIGSPNTQGWIQAPSVQPAYSSDALFSQLTDMAMKIRDEYQNNRFIRISGFDVEIGLPPSVTINFEFKQ